MKIMSIFFKKKRFADGIIYTEIEKHHDKEKYIQDAKTHGTLLRFMCLFQFLLNFNDDKT